MIIRKAIKQDSKIIYEFMFLAMHDIVYEFIGRKDAAKAKSFLKHFIERENNQYSYSNCYVAEIENEIVGSITIYDGATLYFLRQPIVNYIQENFNLNFKPENETQKDEFYIDSLGVSIKHHGKGIGTQLLSFIIEEYAIKNQYTIGLLVDENNPKAQKLYLNLGFKVVGTKFLTGKKMKHLQFKYYKSFHH